MCYLCIHLPVYVLNPLLEFMYLVFTRMPGESYSRRLRSLWLCLCDVFRAMVNSLVCYSAQALRASFCFRLYICW